MALVLLRGRCLLVHVVAPWRVGDVSLCGPRWGSCRPAGGPRPPQMSCLPTRVAVLAPPLWLVAWGQRPSARSPHGDTRAALTSNHSTCIHSFIVVLVTCGGNAISHAIYHSRCAGRGRDPVPFQTPRRAAHPLRHNTRVSGTLLDPPGEGEGVLSTPTPPHP